MKKIVKLFIIVLIVFIVLTLVYNWYEETDIKEEIAVETGTEQEKKDMVTNIIKEEVWEEEEEGYKVIAKLEIPKINLKTNVLEKCDDRSLLVSVGKFWGVNPNEIGNFCVAGHNYYKRTNMFYKVKQLKNNDKIYLTDTKNNCLEYEVYDISKVNPKDISCLSQETDGLREITLITCTIDSEKRIIVKAKEVL